MRIVIDARMYSQSGIGRYIRNLISHLQILDRKNEYIILHLKKDFNELNYKNNFHKVLADFPWYGVREQLMLLKLLKTLKQDLVHFPHFNVPYFYNGKFVVTIHDLIHQHFSMQRSTTHGPIIYKIKKIGYRKIFQRAIKRAEKILVPSNFVKNQLTSESNIPSKKIVVTPEAVDDRLLKVTVTRKFDFPYIFYVGNAHPHKNLEGLIKTFMKLKKKHNLKLVLAGHDNYFWERLKTKFSDKDIIYKGHICEEELVSLYINASVFVMPSFEEGFGIPILESMACGCPVVSSNAGSLPEVGGDACLYFDPYDLGEMGDKIDLVLKSKKLREELISHGLVRVKGFSWKKLTEQTLEVYESCYRT